MGLALLIYTGMDKTSLYTSSGSLFVRDSLSHSLTQSGCPRYVERNYVPLFGLAQSNFGLRYYVISRQIVIQILWCLVLCDTLQNRLLPTVE